MPSRDRPRHDRWWRRPRPPLYGVIALDTGAVWGKGAAFGGLVIACLGGVGAAGSELAWWARGLGVVVAISAGTGIVVLAAYLRRPVSETFATEKAAAWRADLARTGHVDFRVSKVRATWVSLGMLLMVAAMCGMLFLASLGEIVYPILCLAVVVPLGVVPQLEFLTGRGPALRVDAQGIRVARWWPLSIPWSEVRGVHTEHRTVVVVSTTAEFADRYETSRPPLLRALGAGPAWFFTDGIVISNLVAAHPDALACWLAQEASERGGVLRLRPRRRRRLRRRVHRVP